MSIHEPSDDDRLGDGDGDYDDPDFAYVELPAVTDPDVPDGQLVLLLSQIHEYQMSDTICYLEWEGSEDILREAEMIYPTDSYQYVINMLRSWQPHHLHGMEVTTEWPENVVVHRMNRNQESEPTDIERLCHSIHQSFTCLDDIFTVIEERSELSGKESEIAELYLQRHRKISVLTDDLHTLIVDLLFQGHELQDIAYDFLNTSSATVNCDMYNKDILEAGEIGTCRTKAWYFVKNVNINTTDADKKIFPSDITHLSHLQFLIEKLNPDIWDQMYCLYLNALRPTTSDSVIQDVVIRLYNRSQGKIRKAAQDTLIRLGFRHNADDEWRRYNPHSVS